jgi:ABC-type ATPase involved in cell division
MPKTLPDGSRNAYRIMRLKEKLGSRTMASGEIVFDGQDLAKARGRDLRLARRHIGMVFQEYNLVERLSVMENLLSGRLGYVSAWRAWRRRFPDEDVRAALDLLDVVGLAGFADRRADALSGGQRQRVGIARAVMQGPRLLLADEPTSSLDPRTSVEIMQLLADVKEGDLTISKDGPGRLYFRVGMQYAPVDLKPPPMDRGFTVTRKYEAVDKPEDVKRDPDGTWRFKAGAKVRVRVTMVAPARRSSR